MATGGGSYREKSDRTGMLTFSFPLVTRSDATLAFRLEDGRATGLEVKGIAEDRMLARRGAERSVVVLPRSAVRPVLESALAIERGSIRALRRRALEHGFEIRFQPIHCCQV
jgi:hypothetical protein